MRIYVFKSETNGALYAFTGDDGGRKLPTGLAPWHPDGVIEPGKQPPHNFSRIKIETAIKLHGDFIFFRVASAPVQLRAALVAVEDHNHVGCTGNA